MNDDRPDPENPLLSIAYVLGAVVMELSEIKSELREINETLRGRDD